MRLARSIAVISTVTASCTVYGCSTETDEPTDLGFELGSDTGVPWASHTSSANGEVRFLVPERWFER